MTYITPSEAWIRSLKKGSHGPDAGLYGPAGSDEICSASPCWPYFPVR